MKRSKFLKIYTPKKGALALMCSAILVLNACSSSKKGEGTELSFDEIPTFEAPTDEVPAESQELATLDELAPMENAPPLEAADSAALTQFEEPPAMEPYDNAGVAPAAEPYHESTTSYEMPTSAASYGSTPTPAGSGQYESYVFQKGDTLMKIAFETYGDVFKWKDVYALNKDKISNPNDIAPGMVIQVEKPAVPVVIERNGDPYLVKVGDTLRTISTDIYGKSSKWKKLWDNNRQLIKDPNLIFAGFYLYYTMTPEERQEAEMLKQQFSPAPIAGGAGGGDVVEAPRDPAAETQFQ